MRTHVINSLIPSMSSFCGVPMIETDQKAPKPKGNHGTFKITSSYIKDQGQAAEIPHDTEGNYQLKRVESYKMSLSFNAYSNDEDKSASLAEKMRDWIMFHGSDVIADANIALVEVRPIENRDVLLVDDYERRNGFDVIIRVTKTIYSDVDYIETVEISEDKTTLDGSLSFDGEKSFIGY